MRSGGSNSKGNRWENEVCRALSSGGERTDLFRRNVQSGGRHTTASRRGQDPGQPGDVAADHPDAFPFLACWMVECKHHRDLQFMRALWRQTGKLYDFIVTAEQQARTANRMFMLVALPGVT